MYCIQLFYKECMYVVIWNNIVNVLYTTGLYRNVYIL